jgi:hypothetical protein
MVGLAALAVESIVFGVVVLAAAALVLNLALREGDE